MEEGILPGGGVALLRASNRIAYKGPSPDEDIGYKIAVLACKAPIRQIAENAGQDSVVVVAKVAEGLGNFGYDAYKDEYKDLLKAGIIDPTKVVRSALQSAHVQRVSNVLTCEDFCEEVVIPTGDLHFATKAFFERMMLESRDGEAS